MDATYTALKGGPHAAVQAVAGPTAGGRPLRPENSQWELIDLCGIDVEDVQWGGRLFAGIEQAQRGSH